MSETKPRKTRNIKGVAGAIAEAICERHECPERQQELATIVEDNWDAICGPVIDSADNWLYAYHGIRFSDEETPSP